MPGESLKRGQYIESFDSKSWVIVQDDGNTVIYTKTGSTGTVGMGIAENIALSRRKFSWSQRTVTKPVWLRESIAGITLQEDGNLLFLSNTGGVISETGTAGNPGAYLVMQDDANLVLYQSPTVGGLRKPLWASKSTPENKWA